MPHMGTKNVNLSKRDTYPTEYLSKREFSEIKCRCDIEGIPLCPRSTKTPCVKNFCVCFVFLRECLGSTVTYVTYSRSLYHSYSQHVDNKL